jgi:hypothetical protein
MGAVYSTVACYALALVLLPRRRAGIAPLSWPWIGFPESGRRLLRHGDCSCG